MPIIPPGLLDVAVAFGEKHDGKIHWTGSGFLFNHVLSTAADKSQHVRGYVVTNRHVVLPADELYYRIAPRGMNAITGGIGSHDPDTGDSMWTFHPDKSVDIAVSGAIHGRLNQMGLARMLTPFRDTDAYPVDRLRRMGVFEGDPVALIGFPLGLVTEPRPRPIVRRGSIARISDLYDDPSLGDMILDVPVIPGSSGGPVLLLPENITVTDDEPLYEGGLIGIASGFVPVPADPEHPSPGRPENSGLSIAFAVDRIMETVAAHEAAYPLID